MGLPIKLRHVPPRLAAGAFIFNSGLGKRQLKAEDAAGYQEMAVQAFPQIKGLSSENFGKLLSAGEISLGAALLTPVLPSWLVGLGLTAFSGSLMKMYLNTPSLTLEDGVRPSSDGVAIAKDIFMLGIGLGLVVDALTSRGK